MPPRTHLLVAAVIALAAFAVGQLQPLAGMSIVIFASLVWTDWSVQRARRRAG